MDAILEADESGEEIFADVDALVLVGFDAAVVSTGAFSGNATKGVFRS